MWRMLHTRDPLVPPALFRNREFTVVNLATVLLYSSIGVSFFLVSYELQVAAGWSALRAGIALLPATALMFLLSAASGSLAQRIGPRLQLTVGPLLAGAGLLLLARVGPHTSWVSDILPGAFVFGLGLVTFVAPLTATVMAAADPDHVSVASGVNNAIARAASLAALAVVPTISGLSAATGAAQVTHSFRVSLVIVACVAAAAAPLALFGLAHARASPAHGAPYALRGRRRAAATRPAAMSGGGDVGLIEPGRDQVLGIGVAPESFEDARHLEHPLDDRRRAFEEQPPTIGFESCGTGEQHAQPGRVDERHVLESDGDHVRAREDRVVDRIGERRCRRHVDLTSYEDRPGIAAFLARVAGDLVTVRHRNSVSGRSGKRFAPARVQRLAVDRDARRLAGIRVQCGDHMVAGRHFDLLAAARTGQRAHVGDRTRSA